MTSAGEKDNMEWHVTMDGHSPLLLISLKGVSNQSFHPSSSEWCSSGVQRRGEEWSER
jgi:hypothetical protein